MSPALPLGGHLYLGQKGTFLLCVDIPRDDTLTDELRIEALPELSVRNVRELLRTVLPLPQLTEEAAIAQVVKHLVNRTRSRRSRLNRQRQGTRGPIRYVE